MRKLTHNEIKARLIPGAVFFHDGCGDIEYQGEYNEYLFEFKDGEINESGFFEPAKTKTILTDNEVLQLLKENGIDI